MSKKLRVGDIVIWYSRLPKIDTGYCPAQIQAVKSGPTLETPTLDLTCLAPNEINRQMLAVQHASVLMESTSQLKNERGCWLLQDEHQMLLDRDAANKERQAREREEAVARQKLENDLRCQAIDLLKSGTPILDVVRITNLDEQVVRRLAPSVPQLVAAGMDE